MLKKLLLFAIFIQSQGAYAIFMPHGMPDSVRFSRKYANFEDPSTQKQERISYSGEWRYKDPFWNSFRLINTATVALDQDRKSSAITINQNFFTINTLIAAEYVKFFRFGAAIGPILYYKHTFLSFKDETNSSYNFDYGIEARVYLDHAITKKWEIGGDLAFHNRTIDKKIDYSWGFNVGYNY